MRDVAVVSFAQSKNVRKENRRNEVEMLIPVVAQAIDDSGVGRKEIGFTCSGSCDYLAGAPFAFVMGLDAVGAWPPIRESHVEMDGAWALYEAWVRLQHGDVDTALVYSFGKSSLGDLPIVLSQQMDPYYVAPLWPDSVSIAALQAREGLRGVVVGVDAVRDGSQGAAAKERHHLPELVHVAHGRAGQRELVPEHAGEVGHRIGAGGGPAGHEGSAAGQRLDAGKVNRLAHRVGADVHPALAGEAPHLARPVVAGVEDAVVGAELNRPGEVVLAPAGDDGRASEEPGDVQQGLGRPARGPRDENGLSRPQAGPGHEHPPGGEVREPERRSLHGVGVADVEPDQVALRLVGDATTAELQDDGEPLLFGGLHRLVGGGDQALRGDGDAGLRQQLLRLVFGERVCHGACRITRSGAKAKAAGELSRSYRVARDRRYSP